MPDVNVIVTIAAPIEFPFPEFIFLVPSKTQLATTIEYPITKPLTPFVADHSAVLRLNFVSKTHSNGSFLWKLHVINPHNKNLRLLGKGTCYYPITERVLQHLIGYVLKGFEPKHMRDNGSATVADKEKFSLCVEPHTP